FFFFQAEDGIRDFHVTGVQTCALPISDPARPDARARGAPPGRAGRGSPHRGAPPRAVPVTGAVTALRSHPLETAAVARCRRDPAGHRATAAAACTLAGWPSS